MQIEKLILSSLTKDEQYMRKVIPFLTKEYFPNTKEQILFEKIKEFIDSYNTTPDMDALVISVQNDKAITENQFKEIIEYVSDLDYDIKNREWLVDETEKFCKEKALYNAIIKSISIIDGRDQNFSKDGIPQILQTALGVCFDTNVGHDYIDNADTRYDFYHKKESKIPFDLELFNKITNGGLPNKTLNVVLAGTGVGKSLFMCHYASSCLSLGKNVLYITMEMAEERIAERIDANLMNITMDQLKDLPKSLFDSRIEKIRNKTEGRLIIKEYPTAGAHVGHFKSLITELKLKRNFVPDVVIIDYLNICTSSRFKGGANVNSYTLIKSIAEELRGMAVELDVPILSATQTTRGGYGNTDVELTDTSESFGLPATVDFMFALISSEELEQLGQIMVKQLKNRYNDPAFYKRFVIGVDRARMKLFDLEHKAQEGLTDSNQDNYKSRNVSDTMEMPITKRVRDFSGIKL